MHEVPFIERARAVARIYREMTADSSRRILVVAPTHEEIDRVTRAIRNDLSERGHLGQSVRVALRFDLSGEFERNLEAGKRAGAAIQKAIIEYQAEKASGLNCCLTTNGSQAANLEGV